MAQFKLAQNAKWRSLIEVLEVSDLVDGKFNVCLLKSTILSTKSYNPRATGSLCHFMLKVFCTILKPAPFSVNSSTTRVIQFSLSHVCQTDWELPNYLADPDFFIDLFSMLYSGLKSSKHS